MPESPKSKDPDRNAPRRPIREFLRMFRSYGTAIGAIVAATPVVTKIFDLVPYFESHGKTLSFLGTFAATLGAAILFSLRHRIGAHLFPSTDRVLLPEQMRVRARYTIVPFLLGILAVGCFTAWQALMEESVEQAALDFATVSTDDGKERRLRAHLDELAGDVTDVPAKLRFGDQSLAITGAIRTVVEANPPMRIESVRFLGQDAVRAVLASTPAPEIPLRWWIVLSYVVMFVAATMTFVWLGLMEFAQERLGLADKDLMASPFREAQCLEFTLDRVNVVGSSESDAARELVFKLHLSVEPGRVRLLQGPGRPLCAAHDRRLEPVGLAPGERRWLCRFSDEKGKTQDHVIQLDRDNRDILREAVQQARIHLDELRRLHADQPEPG